MALSDLAPDILLLAGTTQQWISRRTDRVIFVDQTTVRRYITLDLEVPALRHPASAVLPLGRFRTGVALGNFTIVDESGQRVTMLNRRDNIEAATAVVKLVVPESEDGDVADLINGTSAEREKAAVKLLEAVEESDHLARSLVVDLVHNYLMLVPLDCSRSRRRSLTITFDEPLIGTTRQADHLDEESVRGPLVFRDAELRKLTSLSPVPTTPTLPERIASWLRWIPERIDWRQNSLGDASSFHVEVEVPRDLEITRARMTVPRPPDDPFIFPADDVGPGAHLYARARQAGLKRWSPGQLAEVSLWIRPRENDLVTAGLVLAMSSAVLLAGGSFVTDQALEARDGAAPLLLAGPTLLSAFLARPGAHPITGRLLRGPRTLIAVAGLLVFAATAVLFIPEAPPSGTAVDAPAWLSWAWWGGGLGCAAIGLLLLVAFLAGRDEPKPESGTVNPSRTRPATVVVTTEAQRYASAHVDEIEEAARAIAGAVPLPREFPEP